MGIKQISLKRRDSFDVPIEKIRIVKGQNVRLEDNFGDLHMLAFQLMAEGQLKPCTGRYSKDGDVFLMNRWGAPVQSRQNCNK